jgi:hypothetical protein
VTSYDEPLVATLARIAAREKWLAVHAMPPVGEPGWHRAAELLDRPAALAEVVDAAAAALAAEHPSAHAAVRRTVAAALLLVDWSWALAVLGAGALAHDRRVPELEPEAVQLRWVDGRVTGIALTTLRFCCTADDPAAGSRYATVTGDLDRAVRSRLQQHLSRLHVALRTSTPPLLRVGPRTMWGAAGDGIATALRLHADGCPDAAELLGVAERLLRGAPASWGRAGFVNGPAGPGRRRSFCCLYYRLPGTAPCGSCPRSTAARRVVGESWLAGGSI